MAREGLEIASRRGSASYGFLMVGNAVNSAIRVGEWPWATALLDEWLSRDITGGYFLELFVDRAVLSSLAGRDAGPDLTEAEALVTNMTDTQYTSYCHWGRAWEAFVQGRLDEARARAESAASVTEYFTPISLPLAARAALWAGDAPAAGALVSQIERFISRGQAITLDHQTLGAGVAALAGRRAEAIAGYRDALRGWRALGLAFDEAMAILDMAILLAPTEAEMPEAGAAVAAAREILTRLDA